MKNLIAEILAEAGVKKNVDDIAEKLYLGISQHVAGQRQSHPSYVSNGKTFVWCSRHKKYHEIDYMVPNKSKKDGVANYCKAAQRKWEWMYKYEQLLMAKSSFFFIAKDYEKAERLVGVSNLLKMSKNDMSSFDNIPVDMDPKEVVTLCEQEYLSELADILNPAKPDESTK